MLINSFFLLLSLLLLPYLYNGIALFSSLSFQSLRVIDFKNVIFLYKVCFCTFKIKGSETKKLAHNFLHNFGEKLLGCEYA